MTTRRFLVVTLVLFTVLTAVMTYPQVFHMTDGVHDDGDPLMVTWVLAWVAHQLPRAPAHLFDANIFYPERSTLAYSETLLVPGAIAAPLHWLGVGPILVYNLVFLSGFAISGVGVALLVRRLTGNVGAAILAGIVFAFPPYRMDHYAHLQLQQSQFIPLAMLAFHRLLDTNRLRDGVWLGVCVACQMLSCMYYGLFLIPYMTIVCGALLIARREMPRRRLIALAVAGAIVAVATLPLGRAYLAARSVVGERARAEVAYGSATWRNYLAPPEVNVVYGKVFARFMEPERRLFPGFIAIALTIVGLWPPLSPTRIAYGLGLLLAFDVSLGLNGLIYRGLYDYVLPFKALRIPARMGLMVGFSLAVLGGYGAARLAERLRSPAARRTVLAAVGLLMLAEYASTPLELFQAPRQPPEIYADLLRDRGDDAPTSVLFEFPTLRTSDPAYLYYSTFHWQTLINGYSGFFPPSYVDLVRAMRNFPDELSIDMIKLHRARYLVIHGEYLRGDRYETLVPQLDRRSDMKLVSRRPWHLPGKHAEISVYRVLYP
ncbi:MAG TPA: glycosyltransferase family 39 protein [Vicinamibacterales bacterium]|nr:glycosyltransferase family 39 protein [Vicinamibacterales bacterium]